MPTLSAGSSYTATIPVGTVLDINGPAELNFGYGRFEYTSKGRFGPFDVSVTVVIKALGEVLYQTYNPDAQNAQVALWANRTALATAGYLSAFFTDIGVGGSYWDYVGGRWRPSGREVTMYNAITPTTLNSATNTVMDYCALPAGVIQDGDWIEFSFLAEKDGTSDTYTVDPCLGTSTTTVGTALGFVAGGLATTARDISPARESFRRETATTVRRTSAGGTQGTGTGTSGVTSITVPTMDALTYLQFVARRSTGTTEILTLRSFVVKLFAGA